MLIALAVAAGTAAATNLLAPAGVVHTSGGTSYSASPPAPDPNLPNAPTLTVGHPYSSTCSLSGTWAASSNAPSAVLNASGGSTGCSTSDQALLWTWTVPATTVAEVVTLTFGSTVNGVADTATYTLTFAGGPETATMTICVDYGAGTPTVSAASVSYN